MSTDDHHPNETEFTREVPLGADGPDNSAVANLSEAGANLVEDGKAPEIAVDANAVTAAPVAACLDRDAPLGSDQVPAVRSVAKTGGVPTDIIHMRSSSDDIMSATTDGPSYFSGDDYTSSGSSATSSPSRSRRVKAPPKTGRKDGSALASAAVPEEPPAPAWCASVGEKKKRLLWGGAILVLVALTAFFGGMAFRPRGGGVPASASSSATSASDNESGGTTVATSGAAGSLLDVEVTAEPTLKPTSDPTVSPTYEPTFEPTFEPTAVPSPSPTIAPSLRPTLSPTRSPTFAPSGGPTISPTFSPTVGPTFRPTFEPTFGPTHEPTLEPTLEPTPVLFNGIGEGEWGKLFDMTLIAIHSMLTPSGHILSYGTDMNGRQRGYLYYEVWNYNKGTGKKSREALEHKTNVDMFCSDMSIDIYTGNTLITGGDTRGETGDSGGGVNDVLQYDWREHEIKKHPKGDMEYDRWYGTSVNLPDGRIFVIGGKGSNADKPSWIPEVWDHEDGFKSLNKAELDADGGWWYPHTWVNSKGDLIVFVCAERKEFPAYYVDIDANNGRGTSEKIKTFDVMIHRRSPSISYRLDKAAVIDREGWLWDIDFSNVQKPKMTKKKNVKHMRLSGMMTVLPDGRVMLIGGSGTEEEKGNTLEDAVYDIMIWDPDTNDLHTGAEQDLARLYHSTAFTLPDGAVVSMGGGAPGPLKNLNGQIYYPDYFYDKKQNESIRPVILDCPKNIKSKDNTFRIEVDNANVIERVTATRVGAATHARNCDLRFLELEFERDGDGTLVVETQNHIHMLAGVWMVSVLNKHGIPSEAKLVGINVHFSL